jgi:hypothetical protein
LSQAVCCCHLAVFVLVEGVDSSSVDCHGYDYVDRSCVCSGDHESGRESLDDLYWTVHGAVEVLEAKEASGVTKRAKIMLRQDFDAVQEVIQMIALAILLGALEKG